MKFLLPLVLAATWCSASVANVTLSLQGGTTESYSKTEDFTSYKMPIGPFTFGPLPFVVAEGRLVTKAWRIRNSGATTLGVMDNLRQQLESKGFELLYECETQECGGFDFRFGTDVLPEPVMHIDLGDFRYLAAQRLGQRVPEYISLFVSRSNDIGYVQMIAVGSPEDQLPEIKGEEPETPPPRLELITTPAPINSLPINEMLIETGHAVLDDLLFKTGSSVLGDGDFTSLQALASFLLEDTKRRVILVGHTDFSGSLSANISLSKKRAQSVMEYLTSKLGVPQAQVFAEGVGYLSPRSANSTEAGRASNRRVEVVLMEEG